jgi:alpha-methylacyl-CoA racemase
VSDQAELLAGVKIIDCSQFVPGPYATLLCSDLGADVIKVEPPHGDPMRTLGGHLEKDGLSPAYKLINRNKTIVTLNLKEKEEAARFTQLLKCADVFFESYRPGAFANLGFSEQELKKINPKLIHISLTGYGLNGPYKSKAGHDLNYVSLAGALALTGSEDKPVMSLPPIADFGGALQALACLASALFYRERTGQGVSLDVSMSESVLAWQAIYFSECKRTKYGAKRGQSLLNGGAAFYQIYRTEDGRFVTIGALEPKFWRNFCEAVGKSDWIVRQGEKLPQTELIREVSQLMETKTQAHWSQLLAEIDCCFEPLYEIPDLLEHAQIKARKVLKEDNQSNLLEVLFPAWIDGNPPPDRKPFSTASAAEVLTKWGAEKNSI